MIKYVIHSIKQFSIQKKLKKTCQYAYQKINEFLRDLFYGQSTCNTTSMQSDYVEEEFLTSIMPIIEETKKLALLYKRGMLTSVPLISIAGCSGSGKTHFAQLLKKTLTFYGYNIFLLEQDNFLQYEEEFPDPIPHINPYLKWKQVHEVIQQIKKGAEQITLPFLNRNTMPYVTEYVTADLRDIDIVLFDGTYSLGDADSYNFFEYCDLGIFLDTSPANSSQWVKDRELSRPAHLQRTPDKLEHDIHAELTRYHRFVVPNKKNASFVIYKEKKNKYSVFVLHKPTKNKKT